MKRVRIDAAGSYGALRLETCPDPEPGPGEVAVAVEACGVNFADCMVRMGLYSSAKDYEGWPITPGFEYAGTVAAVGDGVDLTPGTPVFGVTRFHGYASRVVAPADQVFPLPTNWSPAEAAGFPAVFLTAYYALFELVHPRRGQTLLVHSAAGGVGGALLQLAKVAGCRTVGVVRGAHKVEVAEAYGADVVIDKGVQDLWGAAERASPEGYHAVFDANGVETLAQGYAHLRPTGKLVIYGFATMFRRGGGGKPDWLKLAWSWLRTPRFNPLQLTTDNKSVLAFNLSYLFDERWLLTESMQRLIGWIESGQLRPPPVTTYPLEDVARAHRDIESGTTTGKLVLVP